MQLEDLRRHGAFAVALGFAAILSASGIASADEPAPQEPPDPFAFEALSGDLVQPLDDDQIGAIRGRGETINPSATSNHNPNRKVGMTPMVDSVRLPTPVTSDVSNFSRMQNYGRTVGRF
ncbi:MAG: hypothetical protein QNJ06_22490 [Kiloniellales bacterium]|nr:hypothetical protein [Kiloniellales bacterium]